MSCEVIVPLLLVFGLLIVAYSFAWQVGFRRYCRSFAEYEGRIDEEESTDGYNDVGENEYSVEKFYELLLKDYSKVRDAAILVAGNRLRARLFMLVFFVAALIAAIVISNQTHRCF